MTDIKSVQATAAPAVIQPSAAPAASVATSDAPALGATSAISASADMRATESPMALSARAPQMIKI